ncbi:hypothetical protein QWY82_15160 [Simiduia curdlanivorans]|uniref:Lipase chaperone n=1 Tax=Simiduia curdlanivorans TaxID=1492769 RepID=A0ABV8V3D2_9GAMM|nr:hypothetical protein [Simiduia curdlanivorans]MDN3640138.1 hypothetical protein [Simiduia curdlanivorans]
MYKIGFGIGLFLALIAGTWFLFKPSYSPVAHHEPVASNSRHTADDAPTSDQENLQQQLLLNHDRVQQYLKRQTDKQALQDYFNNPDNDTNEAKAVWLQIEALEAEGGVLGFEALHLKMAWLEKNSTDRAAFEAKAKDLLAQYQEKSQVAAAQYNPENTPEFKSYKAQELDIIRAVNQMETFPRGLTREAYLREKLLAARMAAYGEGAEN